MRAIGDGTALVVDLVVPRGSVGALADRLLAAGARLAGVQAYEALRVEARRPRLGRDSDHRTIPNELEWLTSAVHLDKGCYRGQETVARVHTLGRPPRRLTLLHLDGSDNRLPTRGAPVLVSAGSSGEGKEVGFVGSSARHHEAGPIALALIKRNVGVDADLLADGMPAGQEIVVDPEVGLHIRPLR
jgi:folate-binding protein YgfZ